MFRTSDIVLIAVMVSAAAFTYKTKHEAEDQLVEVRKIEAAIRYEQDSADLLKADWSMIKSSKGVGFSKLVDALTNQFPAQAVNAKRA